MNNDVITAANARPRAGHGSNLSAHDHVRRRGFTLLELMIVVAIIAILAALVYPSYVTYITKSKRKAAEGCLSEYANYMERYYTTNLRYDQDTSATPVANAFFKLDCAQPQQTGNYYTYSWTVAQATYTVTATPSGIQATNDAKCGTLTLNQLGTRGPTTSGCW